jgi:MoxR-like ATPase
MKNTTKKQLFLDALSKIADSGQTDFHRSDLVEAANSIGMKYAPAWIVQDSTRRVDRGIFRVSELSSTKKTPRTDFDRAMQTPDPDYYVMNDANGNEFKCDQNGNPLPKDMDLNSYAMSLVSSSLVPQKMKDFVPWGHFKDIEKIINSGIRANVYVTGLSGNGKTTMIEQVCAKLKKECFRVNITAQTDEDDLLGGFRLVNGETKFVYGPVVEAMKRGGVLLLDEVDLGMAPIMCLQPVLEGKGVFLKKTGEWITPADGFCVFATANTKGKGGEDQNRFAHTNVQNEAFLDRFAFTYEQSYAQKSVEKKILLKKMEKFGNIDADFATHLVNWADITRKAFNEGAVEDVISTRRLEDACKAFAMFGDRVKSLDMILARFDDATKEAFLNLYSKVDADTDIDSDEPALAAEREVIRYDLVVSYEDRDKPKHAGAKWDTEARVWWIDKYTHDQNPDMWKEWNPTPVLEPLKVTL